MKTAAKATLTVTVLALFVMLLSPTNASAQNRHPAYLHALSDLRAARAHLQRPDGGHLRHEEEEAVKEIDKAIDEIKKASIDDGKDLNDHPPVDVHLDWGGRLHRAIELLNKAHADISQEEDNQFAQGLQQRAMGHIDKAHHEVEEAINWTSSHS